MPAKTAPATKTSPKATTKAPASTSKTSPKVAVAPAPVENPTIENTHVPREKVYTPEELAFFQECLEEESRDRISGCDALDFYITRGACPVDAPAGFVYREGLIFRIKELLKLRGIMANSHKDPFNYKDRNGNDKTMSRKEVRQMESALYAELRRLPTVLQNGIDESAKRRKQADKEERIEKKVQEASGLLVFRKEILEVMKGALGKSAVLGDTEVKKTRTGLHNVQHYKYTSQNLDSGLAMFKRQLPTVRPSAINLLMRYMSEKKLPLGVGKKGEASTYFSMPKEFVTAFKKMVGKEPVDIDVEKMIFPDTNKLVNLITQPFSGSLSEKDKEDIMTDISLIDFAKMAAKEIPKTQA